MIFISSWRCNSAGNSMNKCATEQDGGKSIGSMQLDSSKDIFAFFIRLRSFSFFLFLWGGSQFFFGCWFAQKYQGYGLMRYNCYRLLFWNQTSEISIYRKQAIISLTLMLGGCPLQVEGPGSENICRQNDTNIVVSSPVPLDADGYTVFFTANRSSSTGSPDDDVTFILQETRIVHPSNFLFQAVSHTLHFDKNTHTLLVNI